MFNGSCWRTWLARLLHSFLLWTTATEILHLRCPTHKCGVVGHTHRPSPLHFWSHKLFMLEQRDERSETLTTQRTMKLLTLALLPLLALPASAINACDLRDGKGKSSASCFTNDGFAYLSDLVHSGTCTSCQTLVTLPVALFPLLWSTNVCALSVAACPSSPSRMKSARPLQGKDLRLLAASLASLIWRRFKIVAA